MLPKRHRLRHRADIEQVRQHGRVWRHPLAILFVNANGRDVSRFGVSASRFVGNAVKRNRAKRRLREAVRSHLDEIEAGWDCLFVLRQAITSASFAEIEAAVRQLLQRSGLLQSGA